MNWEINHSNPNVIAAYSAYRSYVANVATHYAGARLIEHLDIGSLGDGTRLALSQNFPDAATTISTIGELRSAVSAGDYGQLCLRLATVQLCTAFEMLFLKIADVYKIPTGGLPSVQAFYKPISDTPFSLGNSTIKIIRQLHTQQNFDSRLNDDEVLVKLTGIIEVRNCIVHAAGKVGEKRVQRLRSYGIHHNVGDILHLEDNVLDDFIHYIGIHVMSCLKRLPEFSTDYAQ